MTKLLQVVRAGLRAIREAELQTVPASFTEKAPSDFASQEDFLADAAMVEEATKLFPGVQIFAEESTPELPELLPETFIAIDPLDGSNNRLRERDAWGITATLIVDRIPIEAAAFIRYHGKSFFLKAKKDSGLFVRRVKDGQSFERFRINLDTQGIRYTVPGSPKKSKIPIAHTYQEFLRENDLWRTNVAEGCATANVMSLLCDNTDIYVNAATGNILDVAGLHLMLQEAGGFVSDHSGKPPVWYEPWMPVIFSRNAEIAKPYIMV